MCGRSAPRSQAPEKPELRVLLSRRQLEELTIPSGGPGIRPEELRRQPGGSRISNMIKDVLNENRLREWEEQQGPRSNNGGNPYAGLKI